jgi:hypothetical protein
MLNFVRPVLGVSLRDSEDERAPDETSLEKPGSEARIGGQHALCRALAGKEHFRRAPGAAGHRQPVPGAAGAGGHHRPQHRCANRVKLSVPLSSTDPQSSVFLPRALCAR